MINWLKGRKTYIVAALGFAVQVLYMTGQIDEAIRDNLLVLLGTGAVSTVAAKVNRIQKDIDYYKDAPEK